MNQTTVTADEIEQAAMGGRDTAIALMKRLLKERTGRAWSVRGGNGTAWGWIDVTALPRERVDGGSTITEADRALLAEVFGESVPHQGLSIAASTAHRREYLNRAAGRAHVVAAAYWD